MFGRKRLQRENTALREALGWYATSANWRKHGTNPPGSTPRTWIKSPCAFDRGARAKFILTQFPEKPVPVPDRVYVATVPTVRVDVDQ